MYALAVTFHLGLSDLRHHRRLAVIMALSIALATSLVLLLTAYRAGLADKFSELSPDWLVVHESQSLGEFYGSRLSSQVGALLASQGLGPIIPEIYAVTGTSAQDAVLLRGIDLAQYTQLETFRLLAGRRLQPADPSRLALIGWRLAERRGLQVGQTIALRGRDFSVVGIFQNGTYMDNQAWIALADAQALLGWGQDVSVYIVPRDNGLAEGAPLGAGLTVSRKGESLRFSLAQIQPFFDLLGVEVFTLAVAAALTLTNILWRLAWLRRREMAILRTTGFPTLAMVGYLLAQVSGITGLGLLTSLLFTLLFTAGVQLALPSFTLVPRLEPGSVLAGLGGMVLVVVLGSLLPAWWLSRLNLAQQLHSESIQQEAR